MTKQARSGGKGKIWGPAAGVLLALVIGWWLLGRDRASGAEVGEPDDTIEAKDSTASLHDTKRASSHRPELESEPKATITGTVRTRGGGPIAGAQVCAWADVSELRGLGDGKPRCTKTEHDGHYRLEGLWPVGTSATASAAEHIPEQWRRQGKRVTWRPQLDLRAGEVREGVDFELEPGGAKLVGVVKDISGGEIEDAMVTADGGWGPSSASAVARTDAEGRFELWTRPGEIMLRASAEGYTQSSLFAFAPSSSAELFLTPESVLVGRVVHAQTGEPVPDLTVSGRGDAWYSNDPGSVRSDADGQFRIGGLHPGIYKPTATGDDFFGEAATQVHLGLGQTSEPVEIRVHPVAHVEGRIVKAGTDQGCEEGFITLSRTGTDERAQGQTEPDGTVIIRALLPGKYEVSVFCVGMVAEESYPEIELGNESLVGLVWEVREGQAIRGEVVDGAGKPVPDINVSAQMVVDADNARKQTTGAWGGESADDGSFELTGLLPGRYELRVWGERPMPETPIVVELPSGSDLNDVRVELPASGSVKGRVIDEAGVAQVGVTVSVKPVGKWRDASGVTDDQGNFTIGNVQLGENLVAARSDRWGSSLRKPGTTDDDIQGERVEVVADRSVEVELVVERRDGVIRGKVLDEGGGPVDDAFVSAERMSDSATANASNNRNAVRWDSGNKPNLTEADGSFVLDGLSEGKYVVRAYRKGGGEAIAEDVALGSSIELTIAPTGVLGGVVKVAGGDPPERFNVKARDREQGLWFSDSFFRTEGRWTLRELPAGKYEVSVDSASGNAELEVELAEGGKREDLELTLQPRVTVRGRLVDIDTRAPVAGMKVSISSTGGTFSFGMDEKGDQKDVSDAEGRFEVEHAATGRVNVMIMPRGFNSTSDYGWTYILRTLPSEPEVQDIGDIALVERRTKPEEKAGDLGFELKQNPPETKPEDVEHVVGLIRPGGPAEGSGLEVGDEIESVDGHSVTGTDSAYFHQLTRVPAGTSVELGISGGKKVSITARPPIE